MKDKQGARQIREGLEQAIRQLPVELTSSADISFEIMPEGINKASGVIYCAKIHGIDMRDVMVFGDHENDVCMLKVAGVSVAMENGEEAAKKAASIIAPRARDGGVGAVLEEYVLNRI